MSVADRPTIVFFQHQNIATSNVLATLAEELKSYLNSYQWTEVRPTFAAEERFSSFADWLSEETRSLGNPNKIFQHPAYAEIKGMGDNAVRFALKRIDKEPNLWLIALSDITQQHPVKKRNLGRVSKMVGDWKAWGRVNGYLPA